MISFNVCDSSVHEIHSRSHVCVNSFTLVLHRRSAQATYDMLLNRFVAHADSPKMKFENKQYINLD